VKFRLINVGPIKDAEIELGDFTLFLGLPSTGKSFSLHSIYSSLIMLDNNFLKILRDKILNINAGAIGVDYITAYFDKVLALGNSICDKEFVDNVVNIVNSSGYNVKSSFSPAQEGCSITLVEEVNPVPKINEIISESSKIITESVIEKLRNLAGYEKGSVILINDEEIKSIIERIKPHFKIKQFEQINRLYPPMPLSEGQRDIVITINNKGLVEFVVNFNVKLARKEISKVTKEEIKNALIPGFSSFHRPFIFEILDLDNIFPKDLLKSVISTEYNSVTFIPYGRTQLMLSYNNLVKQINRGLFSTINLSSYLSSILQSPEWLNSSYVSHFTSGLEKLVNVENLNDERISYISEIINGILDLVKLKIEVVKLTPNLPLLYYKIENKKIEPFYASAMVNDVVSVFIPLLDLETPVLVLIEEPEIQAHLAFQLLLALSLLSLVQCGYRFVISTHSDTFVAFIGDLAKYKPDEDNLLHLLQEIFGEDATESEFLKKAVKDAVKTIRNGKIKVYYFEEGKAEERDPTTINFDVPGMTKKVIEKIALWEFDEEEKLYEATSHMQG